MIRVLVDGRISGHDGIGRYTRCLTAALQASGDPRFHIDVLPPTSTPRYSHAEGDELVHAARMCHADVIHLLDYRVPVEPIDIPMLVTVHDVLRLVRPEFCYSDAEFSSRFGIHGLADLRAVTAGLRNAADRPPGAVRAPENLHEEFQARMLALACASAAHIVTPTETVARQLRAAIGGDPRIRTSPYGIDHLRFGRQPVGAPATVGWPYLLYVGQARAHKGLTTLLDAYSRSHAAKTGVQLVCAGRDFAPAAHGTQLLESCLRRPAVLTGTVDDATLLTLYERAEALVHMAEHEGFGFTPLEALAAGTRVIASDISALRETLGDCAVLVDPSDPDELMRAIDRLLDEPDDARIRERRVRWALRFRWQCHAGDILALYEAIA